MKTTTNQELTIWIDFDDLLAQTEELCLGVMAYRAGAPEGFVATLKERGAHYNGTVEQLSHIPGLWVTDGVDLVGQMYDIPQEEWANPEVMNPIYESYMMDIIVTSVVTGHYRDSGLSLEPCDGAIEGLNNLYEFVDGRATLRCMTARPGPEHEANHYFRGDFDVNWFLNEYELNYILDPVQTVYTGNRYIEAVKHLSMPKADAMHEHPTTPIALLDDSVGNHAAVQGHSGLGGSAIILVQMGTDHPTQIGYEERLEADDQLIIAKNRWHDDKAFAELQSRLEMTFQTA